MNFRWSPAAQPGAFGDVQDHTLGTAQQLIHDGVAVVPVGQKLRQLRHAGHRSIINLELLQ